MSDLSVKSDQMKYFLAMANHFVKSGAFHNSITPAQAFVILKAGNEMGLSEVESMQTLYIVNGAIKTYGDKMLAMITKRGYKVKYENETDTNVDVVLFKEGEEVAREKVKDSDQVLKSSKAMRFSKKNKMRFHGIRMIASFHVPHLFSSVQDEFTQDFISTSEKENTPLITNEDLINLMDQSNNPDELTKVFNDNKSAIIKDINLLNHYGKIKARYEKED